MRLNRVLPVAGGIVGAATLISLAATPGAAATSPSGSAYAISANVNVLNALKLNVPALPTSTYPKGSDVALLQTGPLTSPLLDANVLHAKTTFDDGKVHAHADIVDVSVLGLIKANVLDADCYADNHKAWGDADIVHLTIAGKDVVVTAGKPLPIDLAGNLVGQITQNTVTITFDEQIKSGSSLTVNALHVHVGGGLLSALPLGLSGLVDIDLVLSQAKCTPGGGKGEGGGGTGGGAGGGDNGGGAGGGSGDNGGGAATTSDNGNLASTGVSGVVPMTIGGVALLAAGGSALFWAKRRRASNNAS